MRNNDNKDRQLYDSIMTEVMKIVKKKLNENFQYVTTVRNRVADSLSNLFRRNKELSDCSVDTQWVYNNDISIACESVTIAYVRVDPDSKLIKYKFYYDDEYEYPQYKDIYKYIRKTIEDSSYSGWRARQVLDF